MHCCAHVEGTFAPCVLFSSQTLQFGGNKATFSTEDNLPGPVTFTTTDRQQHLQVDKQQSNLFCDLFLASTLIFNESPRRCGQKTDFYLRVAGLVGANPHAQKSAVLTINIGHPVALPAAPHFYCCLALKGSLLSRLDTPRRVVAGFGRIFCFMFYKIKMHGLWICSVK